MVGSRYDDNPPLNSMLYDVEFPNGTVKEYSANVIAENMITQVDSDGFTITTMKVIIDHEKDETTAISKQDMYITTSRGQRRLKKTITGWKLLVEQMDGSESWNPFTDLKESYPVDLAEYYRARGISDEAAFTWWVPYTLKMRDVILLAL